MFNSNVLEVGVGLIFTFLAVSLITGAVIEVITSVTGWRSRTLLHGMQRLLNDKAFTGLAQQIYQHAAVNPRADGSNVPKWDFWKNWNLPAYVDKAQFATSLMDIAGLSTPAGNPAATAPTVATPNAQINNLLQGIIDRHWLSADRIEKIKTEIATWFDNGMDRLSGVYKRWTLLLSFLIALALAAFLNVDSITIAKAVWEQPTLVANLKPPASVPQPEELRLLRIPKLP
jgi:hypothetical protein